MQKGGKRVAPIFAGEGNKPEGRISTAGSRKKLSLKITSRWKQDVRTGLWHVFNR